MITFRVRARRFEESFVEVLHAHVVRVGRVVGQRAGVVAKQLVAAKALDFLQRISKQTSRITKIKKLNLSAELSIFKKVSV